jgi:crossover junction endodeoxyribonuclease RusA
VDTLCVEFFVPGKPATKGSAKAFAYIPKGGGKPRASVVNNDPRCKSWQGVINLHAYQAMRGLGLLEGAVKVRLVFELLRPKSVSEKKRPHPSVRPDIDKLVRAGLDGLTGTVYRDDQQVVELGVVKMYSEREGMRVRVELKE